MFVKLLNCEFCIFFKCGYMLYEESLEVFIDVLCDFIL